MSETRREHTLWSILLEQQLRRRVRLCHRLIARVRELEERIVALEAQLTTRGACQCGDDEVCALARRAQEAERGLDRVRVELVTAQHAIAELEGALNQAAKDLRDGCSNAFGGDDCIESHYSDDDACFACRAARRASLAAERTPTAPAAGAGLCSARVNSAGNLCLMPAGHAGDHYPPTERAPQVIVRTDGTGPNPTPPQEET